MPQPATTASARTARAHVAFALALVFIECQLYLSQDMYLPAMPDVGRDFAVSPWLAQSSVGLWLLGAMVMQPVMGPLSDRHGRRPLLLASCVLFALASLGCALATPFWLFQCLRLLQGACLAGVVVTGYATIHEALSTVEAIRTQAWMGAITVLAPAVGPLLGALMLTTGTWRTIFLVLAAATTLGTFALMRHMPAAAARPDAKAAPSMRAIVATYADLATSARVVAPLGILCAIIAALIAWNVLSPFMLRATFANPDAFVMAQLYLYGLYMLGTRVLNRRIEVIGPERLARRAAALCLGATLLVLLAALCDAPPLLTVALLGGLTLGASLLLGPMMRITLERSQHAMGMRIAMVTTAIDLSGVAVTFGGAWLHIESLRGYAVLATVLASIAFALSRTRAGLGMPIIATPN